MQFIDYYKVLGVEPTADEKTIKTAYRKLARQYHPDVNKEAGAEDKFKEIAEAYDVLKNPEKRAEFDQLRQYANQGGNFEVPGNHRLIMVIFILKRAVMQEIFLIFLNLYLVRADLVVDAQVASLLKDQVVI